MRLLYGVQATGNGHTSRARVMAAALKKSNIEVDYLFSGRAPADMFDMDIFGDFRCMRGMTLYHKNGQLQYGRTILRNNAIQLLRDIAALDLSRYDLVMTDFEPITAWAAKLNKTPCVGMAHQYAFRHDIPKAGANAASILLMTAFAPADTYLGLHWHHWGQPILPPLIEDDKVPAVRDDGKILVYLPFENPDHVLTWLKTTPTYPYYIYTAVPEARDEGNLHLRPFCRDGFLQDFASCSGVISNAGFVMLSEAIHFGKKLLVKPLAGQMEQVSNTKALEDLKLGTSMHHLDSDALAQWLELPPMPARPFPAAAPAIVNWLETGMREPLQEMSGQVWGGMTVKQ